jgi:hypothetical protein
MKRMRQVGPKGYEDWHLSGVFHVRPKPL